MNYETDVFYAPNRWIEMTCVFNNVQQVHHFFVGDGRASTTIQYRMETL
jgi:hypothetical protein